MDETRESKDSPLATMITIGIVGALVSAGLAYLIYIGYENHRDRPINQNERYFSPENQRPYRRQ